MRTPEEAGADEGTAPLARPSFSDPTLTADHSAYRRFRGPVLFRESHVCRSRSAEGSDLRSNLRTQLYEAAIATLLRPRRPIAICRGIAAVVVAALERQACGWFAHITQKRYEARSPSATDLDAASAVVTVTAAVRVLAPIDHARPCSIGARPRPPWGLAVPPVRIAAYLPTQASARLRVTPLEISEPVNALLSAVAPTRRQSIAMPIHSGVSHDRQPSKPGDAHHRGRPLIIGPSTSALMRASTLSWMS